MSLLSNWLEKHGIEEVDIIKTIKVAEDLRNVFDAYQTGVMTGGSDDGRTYVEALDADADDTAVNLVIFYAGAKLPEQLAEILDKLFKR